MARRSTAPSSPPAKPAAPAPPPPGASAKGPAKGGKAGRAPLRRRLLVLLLKLGVLGLLLGIATFLVGYWYYARDLPEFEGLNAWRPPETSRVLAADGTVLAELFNERRTILTREQVSEALVQAITSAEDADFFRHEGLDYLGMTRALLNSVRAGRVTGSGSTITQQTVKNVLLTHEKSFRRKAQEIILTRRIEATLSKEQILMLYLNSIYLGHGRYGVQAAAEFYFGKDAAKLNHNEAATLAGVIQSPERHSPLKHPDAARSRRSYVLDMLVKNGHLEAETAERLRASPLPVKPAAARVEPVEAQWFVTQVRRQAMALLGEQAVLEGGLRIQTTLDPKRQAAALAAVRHGVREIEARQGYDKPTARVVGEAAVAAWQAERKKALGGLPPPAGRETPARFVVRMGDDWEVDLGVGTARLRGEAVARLAKGHPQVGDVFTVKVRADGPQHPKRMEAMLANGPQGALVAIDPRTRHVLAWVGGTDHGESPFDRVVQARRQPGSAFKTFVWGAAFASRRYHPGSILVDAPETWQLKPGEWWQPKNYTGKFRGPLSLRDALADSINSIAIKLTHDVSVPAVHTFARQAGIKSRLDPYLSLALGSSEVTPLELVNAYATLAADGRCAEPVLITAILGPDGQSALPEGVVLNALTEVEAPVVDEDAPDDEPPPPPVAITGLDAAQAWLLRDVLRSVVTQGSAKSLKDFQRPLVGKTGTSNESMDTWFVALLPEVAAGVWFGFDTPKRLGKRESGGASAVPAMAVYLKAAEARGVEWPPPPDGLVAHHLDPTTGLLAAEGQPGISEWFLRGTEPTRQAAPAGEVDVDSFFANEVQGLPGQAGDPGAPRPALPTLDASALLPAAPRTVRPAEPSPANPPADRRSPFLPPPISPVPNTATGAGAGPSVAVPRIDVAPIPDALRPLDPVKVRPAGAPTLDDGPALEDGPTDDHPTDDDEGTQAPPEDDPAFDADRFDEDRPED